MTTVAAPASSSPPAWLVVGRAARRTVVAVASPRTWAAQVQLLLDAVFGLLTGVPVFVLVTMTLVFLPILPASLVIFLVLLFVSRLLGRLERARRAAVPGQLLADPHPRRHGRAWRRLLAHVRSGATWKEIAYHHIHLPVAVVFLVVSLLTWATALTLVSLPAWISAVPAERVLLGPVRVRPGAGAWIVAALGAALLLAAPWLVRGLARLSSGLAAGLLGRNEADVLRARVGTLEVSRARVTDAAEIERQRIERNLHDGAQQRLVALAMALGLAREKFDTDPGAARALVDEAHGEAKRALVELRDLARGLHPPVLTDRGLDAAVAGLAGRSPVPVAVSVDLHRRPTPTVEGIAYFVIAESLANVARHAGARSAQVRVADLGDRLLVEVADDGRGGADGTRGTGLRGLADRVAAVDGSFAVMSPVGGPTTVRAELPLPATATAAPAGGVPAGGAG